MSDLKEGGYIVDLNWDEGNDLIHAIFENEEDDPAIDNVIENYLLLSKNYLLVLDVMRFLMIDLMERKSHICLGVSCPTCQNMMKIRIVQLLLKSLKDPNA